MSYQGTRVVVSASQSHLGGNIAEGDPFTFSPTVWDYLMTVSLLIPCSISALVAAMPPIISSGAVSRSSLSMASLRTAEKRNSRPCVAISPRLPSFVALISFTARKSPNISKARLSTISFNL